MSPSHSWLSVQKVYYLRFRVCLFVKCRYREPHNHVLSTRCLDAILRSAHSQTFLWNVSCSRKQCHGLGFCRIVMPRSVAPRCYDSKHQGKRILPLLLPNPILFAVSILFTSTYCIRSNHQSSQSILFNPSKKIRAHVLPARRVSHPSRPPQPPVFVAPRPYIASRFFLLAFF